MESNLFQLDNSSLTVCRALFSYAVSLPYMITCVTNWGGAEAPPVTSRGSTAQWASMRDLRQWSHNSIDCLLHDFDTYPHPLNFISLFSKMMLVMFVPQRLWWVLKKESSCPAINQKELFSSEAPFGWHGHHTWSHHTRGLAHYLRLKEVIKGRLQNGLIRALYPCFPTRKH